MNASSETSGRYRPPAQGPREAGKRELRRAWLSTAVALAVVMGAAIWGPKPGDSVFWLVAQLVVIVVLGLGAAVAAVWFGARALRAGRNLALVPMVIGVFLVLQALLRVVGTLGRYYHWG